jgi:2-oxoglutarate dehydrogenase E1 component
MDSPFTYEQFFLSEEFDNYLTSSSKTSHELASFFDGFILGLKDSATVTSKDVEAMKLVHMYRHFGYLMANFNPLKNPAGFQLPEFKTKDDELVPSFGLKNEDVISFLNLKQTLHKIYSGSVGYEFLHCSKEIMNFIQNYIEAAQVQKHSLNDLDVYKLLAEAEHFETFLHTRFPGQKRFSIEGVETSIVFLQETLQFAESLGYQAAYFGMAHRGRLNVLANIFHKPLDLIFQEFTSKTLPQDESNLGDVKYHHGAYFKKDSGFEMTLSSNPSHLEAVDPVVLGMSYAKQKTSNMKTLTYMIHGDASFAGQGVVYETMQISKIKDFDPSGVIHVILNNQIGFTAMPQESRSTPFATDLAKTFNCPIFHVNSEDVAALQKIAKLACELVSRFGCDVMIDIVGYRKWGHNESDEPFFTQPLLYKMLKERKNPLDIYKEQLISQSLASTAQLDEIDLKIKDNLQAHFDKPTQTLSSKVESTRQDVIQCDESSLIKLGEKITTIPQQFHIHQKLNKLFNERLASIQKKEGIDFALAELLALGVCLEHGRNVRFVGQDSQRGTFSQRHFVLIDQENETPYNIFTPVLKNSQYCQIVNSPLSEYAVLGFEYGFSKIAQGTLCLWEAQFGDFANGAQIIIDQFIASGKTKWNDHSGLVLLLPHGYEGQGPEHTSGRIERFLELAGDNNMTIAVPSTPAQYFKLLKDQVSKTSPLVIFTPKALLRHPACKSSIKECISSHFEPIIDDHNQEASCAVICYGKIYYDLKKHKEEKKLDHISLIRLEQLYPLNKEALSTLLNGKQKLKKVVLVQDEPFNMGACMYLKSHIEHLEVISRKQASSPATGYSSLHEKQFKDIITQFETL